MKLFKSLFRTKSKPTSKADHEALLNEARTLQNQGKSRESIEKYRRYLKVDATNLDALNFLGAALVEVGDSEGAIKTFELAYLLDDTHLPSIVNYAKLLFDQNKMEEALQRLEWAKASNPDFYHTNSIYAAIRLKCGDVESARKYQLSAWLAAFDNLRMANCFVFNNAYADISEERLASEHLFWAKTVKPVEDIKNIISTQGINNKSRKIRIGYWSPDFRSHSVRYFFRPLLENHDKQKFEIFLYHDIPVRDGETEKIAHCATRFFDVSSMSDAEFVKYIQSHELDFLVEMAGHSSTNRVHLLQSKLATFQISGIGYPPTTGLESIDFKLLDPNLLTDEYSKFVAESPLVLDESFWCFDPMEDAPLAHEPPLLNNGYVTFGCYGNIAKINSRMLDSWKQILRRVPRSRLIIQSINFEDPFAKKSFENLLRQLDFPLDRTALFEPKGGSAYFQSYNEIDIVLDTFPFNGGTTSCFATYMGVPIISMAGKSLISRMGASILKNAGAEDLIAFDEKSYVSKAVALSQDVKRLQVMKKGLRKKISQTALGDGKIFAMHLENKLEKLFLNPQEYTPIFKHNIAPLPVEEIVRRAYTVQQLGQHDAAERIIAYCLQEYPESGVAHILATNEFVLRLEFEKAAEYLLDRLNELSRSDKNAVLINVIRYLILGNQPGKALNVSRRLSQSIENDPIEAAQAMLYRCALESGSYQAENKRPFLTQNLVCIVPCNDLDIFEKIRANVLEIADKDNLSVQCVRCNEMEKTKTYYGFVEDERFDIVLIIQKNIKICSTDFFLKILHDLTLSDAVGISGSKKWERLDWTTEDFVDKAGGFLVSSNEKENFLEIQLWGLEQESVIDNMVVIDGLVLAFNRKAMAGIGMEEVLSGANVFLEQDWMHAAYLKGRKLSVDRCLGVIIERGCLLPHDNIAEARICLVQKYGLTIFDSRREDRMFVSCPETSELNALNTMNIFFSTKLH